METLKLIFPFKGYLHIYQLVEYSPKEFLTWVWLHPFSRRLETVGTLKWTQKAKLLLYVSVAIYCLVLLFFVDTFDGPNFVVDVPFFLFFAGLTTFLIPLWLTIASFLIRPLEMYLKNKIVTSAKNKLASFPNLKVIAVAGSVGKSSTRSYTTQLLASKYKTQTPPGNHNTVMGIAEDIVKNLKTETEYYVVELGEYHPGELVKMANLIKPQLLILTKVGSQHIERFGSQQGINEEFLSLVNYDTIKKVYVNENNKLRDEIKNKDKEVTDPAKTKTHYGKSGLKLPHSDSTFENLALAIAVAENEKVEKGDIERTVRSLESFDQRLKVSEKNGVTIIDDSYNISPESAENALNFLLSFDGRKVVVTGGIVDQGHDATKMNKELGRQLAAVADVVVVANNEFHNAILDGLNEAKNDVESVTSPHPQKTPEILAAKLKPGDVVLIQNELPEIYWH